MYMKKLDTKTYITKNVNHLFSLKIFVMYKKTVQWYGKNRNVLKIEK